MKARATVGQGRFVEDNMFTPASQVEVLGDIKMERDTSCRSQRRRGREGEE